MALPGDSRRPSRRYRRGQARSEPPKEEARTFWTCHVDATDQKKRTALHHAAMGQYDDRGGRGHRASSALFAAMIGRFSRGGFEESEAEVFWRPQGRGGIPTGWA